MLTNDQIEALRVSSGGKVAVVDFSGHQLVFKRASREAAREYRRKRENPAESPDALDQLAQATLVAFDGETMGEKARLMFLAFLNEYPNFGNTAKALSALASMVGLMEAEDEADMGKGVSVRSAPPKPTPKDSPTGSVLSSEVKN